MRVELNGYFRALPFTGSGQYLRHLAAALQRGYPGIEIVEREPPRALRGALGKVFWEQVAWLRASRDGADAVRHVPYLAPPLADRACVVTAHDVIPFVLPAYGAGVLQRCYGLTVRVGLRGARQIVADSEATRRDLIRVMGLPAERIRTIPLGVDDRFRPASARERARLRDELGLPERFALYLGSLDLRKNLSVLLRAWPQVWARHHLPLVVAGRAPRPGSRVFVDWFKGLDARTAPWLVRRGFVEETVKPAIYQAATIFVFPSRYEGFGLDPLEAMAAGVPVVAAHAASLPEVVQGAGVLAPPDDAQAWFEAVERLLSDRAHYQRLAEAGPARACAFTWDETARLTHAVYREALA